MVSCVSSSAVFVCLIAAALACSPTGSPGTGNSVSPTADFTMTVEPPAEWSYSDAPVPPQRSFSKDGAQKIIRDQINQAINEILVDNKYAVGAVKLIIDDVDISGNILEGVDIPDANAACTKVGFLLSGKTIAKECKEVGADKKATEFKTTIGGTFDAKDSGIVVTEAMWKGFAVKLQKALSDKGAVFIENLVATPTKTA